MKKDVAVGHVFFSLSKKFEMSFFDRANAAQFEYRLIRRPLADNFPSRGRQGRRKIFVRHLWNAKPCCFVCIFDTGQAQ